MLLLCTPRCVVLGQLKQTPTCAFVALTLIKAARMDDDTVGAQLRLD